MPHVAVAGRPALAAALLDEPAWTRLAAAVRVLHLLERIGEQEIDVVTS